MPNATGPPDGKDPDHRSIELGMAILLVVLAIIGYRGIVHYARISSSPTAIGATIQW